MVQWSITALGAVFAVMNYSFYLALDCLPLGTVAAIEFLGPIALALLGSRSARNMCALLPVCAVVIGVIVLHQVPSMVEALRVFLVVLGVAAHRPTD